MPGVPSGVFYGPAFDVPSLGLTAIFSMSATRYYQVLNALVDRPEALAADPMLVKRLRRLRATRQKARAARRLGFEIT